MPNKGLRLNLKLDLFLVGLLLAAIVSYALVILVVSDKLEQELLNKLVRSEYFAVEAQLPEHRQVLLPNRSVTRAWYASDTAGALPPELAALPLGLSHDVAVNGHRFHIYKKPAHDGQLVVGVDISAIESREDMLLRTILVGGLVVLVLLVLIGRFFTRRLVGPVVTMASELDAAEAGNTELSFSDRFAASETGTIAKALDGYIARISQMIKRERSFSAAASHELRSPLTVIRSSLELALEANSLPPRSQATLQRASTQAKRLNDMLDGLMLLARDETVTLAPPLELATLTKELVSGFQNALRQAGQCPNIELRCVDQLELTVEESHWRIMLSNLLRNAIEHSSAQRICVSLDAQGLCVEDDGCGVDPALLPNIFGHGQRDKGSLGAGLGLYIVAEICRRQHWQPVAQNSNLGGLKVLVAFSH